MGARFDQALAEAQLHGHVLPTYIQLPGGHTPPRRWVPAPGSQQAAAIAQGEWREISSKATTPLSKSARSAQSTPRRVPQPPPRSTGLRAASWRTHAPPSASQLLGPVGPIGSLSDRSSARRGRYGRRQPDVEQELRDAQSEISRLREQLGLAPPTPPLPTPPSQLLLKPPQPPPLLLADSPLPPPPTGGGRSSIIGGGALSPPPWTASSAASWSARRQTRQIPSPCGGNPPTTAHSVASSEQSERSAVSALLRAQFK